MLHDHMWLTWTTAKQTMIENPHVARWDVTEKPHHVEDLIIDLHRDSTKLPHYQPNLTLKWYQNGTVQVYM